MKKIALIIHDMTTRGGAETATAALANGLAETYECHLISLGCKNSKTPYALHKDIRYFTAIPKPQGENLTRLREYAKYSKKPVRKYLKENHIDIVFLINFYTAATSVNYLFSPKKIVYCDHGNLNALAKTDLILSKLSSIIAKKTVVLTEKNKKSYQKRFKTPEKKLICIPNWIDEKLLANPKNYDENTNRIISMGRISMIKGPDLLIKTAKKLRERNDNWVWDVYGSGDAFEDFQKWIQEEGLEGWVIPHGMTNDPYGKYPGHAMEVLTSYSEGLPLALLEAKANYLPLVSFDIHTGPSDIITDGIDGYLIEPYNTDRMAEKIDQLLRDKALRKNFSQHARDNLDKFKKETILKKWIDLIESL